jgi:hypothetical protein
MTDDSAPGALGYGEAIRRAHEAGGDLLITDMELALTLLDPCDLAIEESSRTRSYRKAREAYETALKFAPRLRLDPDRHRRLDELLTQVQTRLRSAASSNVT